MPNPAPEGALDRAHLVIATSTFPGPSWARPCSRRRAVLVGYTDRTGEDHICASVNY